MSVKDNHADNTTETLENITHGKYESRSVTSRLLADGGASWSSLSGIQRDILEAIARIDRDDEKVIGLVIHDELESRAPGLTRSRVYSNLDSLVEIGLVEKDEIDGRTNRYALTPEAQSMLKHHVHLAADSVGLSVTERAVPDGGRNE